MEKFGIPLAGFIAAIALFMVLSIFKREKAKEILGQDGLGFIAFLVGFVTVVISAFLAEPWSVTGLALGGFIAGFGALIALPNRLSDALTAPRNIGLIVAVLGVVIVFYYTIAPTWQYVVQAAKILWDNTKVTQALALVGGALVIVIGFAIYGRRSK